MVRCDIVNCKYNYGCNCCAEVIDIVPDHIGDFEYIKCQTYREEKHEPKITPEANR